MNDNLSVRVREYQNTAEHNDRLFSEFTELTNSVPWLRSHRDLIEENKWGYGERAFHYMWLLLLLDLSQRKQCINCFEIGIFKGQVISLWSKISKELGISISVTGISPFTGNVKLTSRVWQKFRSAVDSEYKEMAVVGNLHPKADYLSIVKEVFSTFDIEMTNVSLIKGFSNDPTVLDRFNGAQFDLVYIDGDHSFEGACSDIFNYAPLISEGGYLVMDDAAFFLPGDSYWKGFESVSRAAEEIPHLGFSNILNVGHNRIYQKMNQAPSDCFIHEPTRS